MTFFLSCSRNKKYRFSHDVNQKSKQFPVGKVHLIGYSLGAHISGFAGSKLAVSGKTLGRITVK